MALGGTAGMSASACAAGVASARALDLLDAAPVAPTELGPFIDHLTEHMVKLTFPFTAKLKSLSD